MIFTRIRVGECQTLANGGKTHVSPPCFIQPLPLKSLLSSWGSYCLGVGVVGLSVLAHTHTPPAVDFTMEKETTVITPAKTHYCTLSMLVLKHSRTLHYIGLTIVCSSTHRSESLVHYSHAQDFPGFGLTQRAGSRALSSTICCEGTIHVFGYMTSSQTGMVV